jgi:hypothetical protein
MSSDAKFQDYILVEMKQFGNYKSNTIFKKIKRIILTKKAKKQQKIIWYLFS